MNHRRKLCCTSARTADAFCERSQANSDWSALRVTRINSKRSTRPLSLDRGCCNGCFGGARVANRNSGEPCVVLTAISTICLALSFASPAAPAWRASTSGVRDATPSTRRIPLPACPADSSCKQERRALGRRTFSSQDNPQRQPLVPKTPHRSR